MNADSLELRFNTPNENDENLTIECESNSRSDERYTLRIAGNKSYKGEIIILTGEEFDSLAGIVQTFRKMKGCL